MASKKVRRYESGPRRGQPVDEKSPTGRPLEGVADWPIDHAIYTEWALLHRGYVLREEGSWLTGYYHFNRPGIRIGGGGPGSHGDTRNLDEQGFNEIAFTPVGVETVWNVDSNWKVNYPGLYSWYHSDDMRPYFHSAILFIKNDTYVHTEGTSDGDWAGRRKKK